MTGQRLLSGAAPLAFALTESDFTGSPTRWTFDP
jgi:hypothetical protein